MQLLVTRFMPLNPTDLENWTNDPEEWVNVEDRENDLWEYEIRVSRLWLQSLIYSDLPHDFLQFSHVVSGC